MYWKYIAIRFFYFFILFFNLVWLVACVPVKGAKEDAGELTLPDVYNGIWTGMSLKDSLSLVVTSERVLLRVTGRSFAQSGTVELKFLKKYNANSYLLSIPGSTQKVNKGVRAIAETPLLSYQHVLISYKSNRYAPNDQLQLSFFGKLGSYGGRPARLMKARPASFSERGTAQRGSLTTLFLYRDQFSNASFITSISPRQALENRAVQLLSQGFQCIHQMNLMVHPGQLSRATVRGDSGSLYLIFSPGAHRNLVYNVTSDQYQRINIQGAAADFPSIVSRPVVGRRTTQINFWQLPDETSTTFSSSSIPVTVYAFSGRLGEQGSSCEFESTDTLRYAMASIKLLFAIVMEKDRRNGEINNDKLQQGIAIYGRDYSIGSALGDLFPELDDSSVNYLTRIISSVMQDGFNILTLSSALEREALIQKVESQTNLAAHHLIRFMDILATVNEL